MWTLKVLNVVDFISNDVVDLEWLPLGFDHYVLIELFHKLNLPQVALVGKIHQVLPVVHIYHSHWYLITHRLIDQKHNTIAKRLSEIVAAAYQILNSDMFGFVIV